MLNFKCNTNIQPLRLVLVLVIWSVSCLPVVSLSRKKGVSLTRWQLLCHDFDQYRGKVSWWYDWDALPTYWTNPDMSATCGPLLENRAAMQWGWPANDPTFRVQFPPEAKVILGYNEPNHRDQANLTAQEAARHWPEIERAAGNRTLVGPSAIQCGPPSCQQDIWQWFGDFFSHCPNCRVDFMAVHLYTCDAHRDMQFVEQMYNRYHKRVYVTEFACPYKQTLEDQLTYMKAILPQLEASPHVEAYSWFISRWRMDDWFLSPNVGLLQQHSSSLTPLGQYYLDFNN